MASHHVFDNMTIFVTGATGFLAKLFVEKIIRTQPNIKKMYLLIRADDISSANQRLQDEVIDEELFGVVGELWGKDRIRSFISEKIVAVPGDIKSFNFGIKEDDDDDDDVDSNNVMLQNMFTNIDIIVHSAATVKFDERYDDAINTNLKGAMNVLSFAKKCSNLKLLLHVSTAYVCGEKEGYISEKPFYMGESLNGVDGLNIETEINMMEEELSKLKAMKITEKEVRLAMKNMGMQRAKKYGWPNTYVFTKAMAEMWLGHWKGDIRLVIMRPTIISSTFKDPFPGWIQGLGTMNSLILAYAKGMMKCIPIDPQAVFDAIPGDMVVNAIICAIITNMKIIHFHDTIIYHIGTSMRNPLTSGLIIDLTIKYFALNPLLDDRGKIIKVSKLRLFDTFDDFNAYIKFYYLMPLKGLQLVNKLTCQSIIGSTCEKLDKRINYLIRLADIFKPYLFFKLIFEDKNTENLLNGRKIYGIDELMFDFSPDSIDWEEYFMNSHFLGIVKYLF